MTSHGLQGTPPVKNRKPNVTMPAVIEMMGMEDKTVRRMISDEAGKVDEIHFADEVGLIMADALCDTPTSAKSRERMINWAVGKTPNLLRSRARQRAMATIEAKFDPARFGRGMMKLNAEITNAMATRFGEGCRHYTPDPFKGNAERTFFNTPDPWDILGG